MNKSLHRIVFNKARGILMAVAETAVANGKTPGERSGGNWSLTAALTPTRFAVLLALGLVQPALDVNAQVIADQNAPRNQQPTVLNAGNGVPLINIQTPSAAGVSRNTYSQFDVGSQGAIVNNARANVQTQLGGWVQGNPWLASGTARVVLNEVNSNSPSQLRGFIEVAGDKAQVVIANAAGITCDGCGFLNATRATLTTGTAQFQNGVLDSFRVTGGTVRIEGAGLDGSRIEYTDIIARAVEVNAALWANDLSVSTGPGEYKLDRAGHTSTPVSGTAPSFGVDVSQLGGMYAGRIVLVGTEGGVGVRNAGTIGASAGEVLVDINGMLTNAGQVSAAGKLAVQARDGVQNSGTVYSTDSVSVNVSRESARITNSGLVGAAGDVRLNATGASSAIEASQGSVLAAGLRSDGTLSQSGALSAAATGAVTTHGQVIAGADLSLSGGTVVLTDAELSASNVAVQASQGDVDASRGTLVARNLLSLDASNTIRTDAASVSADRLQIAGNSLSNARGQLTQTGSNELDIRLLGSLNNAGGRIATNSQNLAVAASTIDNRAGSIEHAGTGNAHVQATAVEGSGGRIASDGHLTIRADHLRADEGVTVARQLTVAGAELSNRGGQMLSTSGEPVSVVFSGAVDNTGGVIASNGATSVKAGSLHNRGGTLQSAGQASMTLTVGGTLDNNAGTVLAAGNATVQAGAISNAQGRVSAGGDLALRAGTDVDNSDGVLVASGALRAEANNIVNTRGVVQGNAVEVSASATFTNALGEVSAKSTLDLTAGTFANSGKVYSEGNLTLAASGAISNAGVVAAQGNASVRGSTVESSSASVLAGGLRRDGSVSSTGNLSVSADGSVRVNGQNLAAGQLNITGDNLDLSGSITEGQQIGLSAQSDVSTSDAEVRARSSLVVSGQLVRNQAGLLTADAVRITTRAMDNTGGEVVQTGASATRLENLASFNNAGGRIATNGTDLRISAEDLVNTGGRIEHAGSGTLTLEATRLGGARGAVISNGLLQVQAGDVNWDGGVVSSDRLSVSALSLSNRGGQVLQTGSGTAQLQIAGALDNTGGTVAANGGIALASGSLDNTSGTVQAVGSGGLQVTTTAALTNAEGRISSSGPLTVQAGSTLNNDRGDLLSGQALTLNAGALSNTQGTIQNGAGAIDLGVTGSLSNASGTIVSAGALDIRTGTLTNSGTVFADGDLRVSATGAVSHAGVLAAKGNARLDAGQLDAAAGSLLAAGMRADGTFAGPGQLSIDAQQSLVARGQNLAAGSLTLQGSSVDLSDSTTAGVNITVKATQANVSTARASVTASGGLTVSANALPNQSIDNTDGELIGGQVSVGAGNLTNLRGTLVQTGTGATDIVVSGKLDNTGGKLASNGNVLGVSAQHLVNTDGRIEHAGSGALTVQAAQLDGVRGAVATNGTLNLSGGNAILDGGTVSAESVEVSVTNLQNRSGQIIQTGSGATSISASNGLDNAGGLIASNGSTTLTVGKLDNVAGTIQAAGASALLVTSSSAVDNSNGGRLSAGGDVAVTASSVVNATGSIIAARDLNVLVSGTVDCTAGTMVAGRALSVGAGNVDNTRGVLQAATIGDLTVTGSFNNTLGQVYTGGSLAVQAGALITSGLMASQGDVTLHVGQLDASTDSLLAAGLKADGQLLASGNLTVTAQQGLAAHGQVLAGGNLGLTGSGVDLSSSQVSGSNVAIAATSGNVDTSGAIVSARDRLSVTADKSTSQFLVNRNGQLAAGTLALQTSNLSNVQGTLVQTGTASLNMAFVGSIDNSLGRIASNSTSWTLSAANLTNTDGRLEHAGSGTFTIQTGAVAGTRGAIVGNGSVNLTGGNVVLDGGVLSAERISLQAAALSNRDGDIVQTGQGTSTVTVSGALDNTAGRIASNGDTTLSAGALNNQNGVVQTGAAANLTLAVSGLLDNSAGGLVSGNGNVLVNAGSVSNALGQITAGQSVNVTSTGAVDNQAGVLAATGAATVAGASVDNRSGTIGSVQSSVSVTSSISSLLNDGGRIEAAQSVGISARGLHNVGGSIGGTGVTVNTAGLTVDNTQGTIASRGALDVQSGTLSNDRGLLQAAGGLTVDTHGQSLSNTNAGAAGGIVGQGTVTLQTGALLNDAGFIGSRGQLQATSAAVSNTNGGTITSESGIQVRGTSLDNRGGQVQALGDVTVSAAGGAVNNSGSLLRSGGTLTVTAAQVVNTNTTGANQGLEGKSISVAAAAVDNNAGAIRADESLTLTSSGTVGNASGLVSSGSTVSVRDASGSSKTLSVHNESGTFIAGEGLSLDLASLTGTGKLLSEGDLTLKLVGNYTNTGTFQAAGSATLETTGTLTNAAKLLAGHSIAVRASNIDNTSSGEISAAQTVVAATQTVTNRGLIDGERTRVSGTSVDNVGTGRLYGDELAVQAGTLVNRAENGTAAVIAARSRLDIGAGSITNSGHGLIFSAGDVAIGGSLDANHRAVGQTTALQNAGSTIEALGNLTISAQRVNNLNTNFSTHNVQLASTKIVEYLVDNTPSWYSEADSTLTNGAADGLALLTTPDGVGDGFQRRTYTRTVEETQILTTDPGQILAGGNLRIDASTVLNDRSRIIAGGALTGTIGALENRGESGHRTTTDSGIHESYWRNRKSGKDSQGYGAVAYAPAQVVQDIQVGTGIYLQSTPTQGSGTQVGALTQTALTESAVGAGSAAAALRPGSIIEVRSTVGANAVSTGGVASVSGPSASTSVGGVATALVGGPDAATASNVDASGATIGPQSHSPLGTSSGIAVPGTVNGELATADAGASAPPRTEAIQTAAETASAPQTAAPGPSLVVRAVVPNITLPDSALFRQNPDAGGKYLIETDPRFSNYRSWLSSDYLLDQLKVDPAMTQKRIGDGFYEQKLVREQVAELTGRRFIDGYANDEAQYQALMTAGATYAKEWSLLPGVALTPEQMAQLTTDIVWLVERPVTLADGSVQKVLVPQVYVRVKEGDIDGSGALLAGGSMDLNLTGDLKNSGTIAGRTVVNITAENIANLGGRISGGDVALSARNDLDHLGGLISGNNSLAISAGRDINVVTSTVSASSSQGSVTNINRVAALYVGDGGGPLVATAGRDVNLVAATVVNASATGQTVITAGRDLKLGTVVEASDNLAVRDANNWRKEWQSTEVGTTVTGIGNVQLNAGRDIDARAANLTSAEGMLKAAAGDNLSITAGASTFGFDEAHKYAGGNSLTRKTTTTTRTTVEQTGVVGSNLSGNTVVLRAGDKAAGVGDILIQGSNVKSEGATEIHAGRDVNIVAAEGSVSERRDSQSVKESKGLVKGLGQALNPLSLLAPQANLASFEGAYLTTTKNGSTGAEQGTKYQVGSSISAGSVSVSSGRDVTVQASTLVADGNLDVAAGRNLNIVSGQNRTDSETSSSSSKTGFVGSWYQPAAGKVKQSQGTEEGQVQQAGSQVASLNGNVQLRAGETYTQTSSQVLAPKGDIAISAQQVDIGAAHDSATGKNFTDFSKTAHGGSVSIPLLEAAKGIKQAIDAGQKTGDSRLEALAALNAGMQAFQAISTTNPNNPAVGIKISASLGHNESHSESTQSGTTAVGSQVKAGGNVDIVASGAGKDSALRITGSDIQAGGNVALKSEGQVDLVAATNTAEQHSKNSSSSASVGVGFTIGGQQNGFTIDIAASAARGKADGTDRTNANSHVEAGKTLTIESGADTNLKGAVAKGDQVVAKVGGNLNLESLQDTTTFDSKQESAGVSISICIPPFCVGVSGSASYSQGKVNGDFASVTEQTGLKAGDGGFQVSVAGNTDLKGAVVTSTQAAVDAKVNTLATGSLTASSIENHDVYDAKSISVSVGTGGGSGAAFQKSGDQKSVTESGISDAAVTVAGSTTGNVVSSVRSEIDSSASLGQTWDGQKLQEQVTAATSVIAQFGSSASKLVGDYASKKTKPIEDARDYEKYKKALEAGEDIGPAATNWLAKMDSQGYSLEQSRSVQSNPDAIREYEEWKEGGAYRVAAHAAVGGLTGNLQGALGAAASAASAPALDALQAGFQNLLTESGVDPSTAMQLARVAGGLTATAVGATASGGSAAGAAAGFNQDMNNRQLHPKEIAWIKANAKAFAAMHGGMTVEEAEARLAAQAFRQVQFGAPGEADAVAMSFLSQAGRGAETLPPDPGAGPNANVGYMFLAPPEQKANALMYLSALSSSPEAVSFYAKHGITQPTIAQIIQAASKDSAQRDVVANRVIVAAALAGAIVLSPAAAGLAAEAAAFAKNPITYCLANPGGCTVTAEALACASAGGACPPGTMVPSVRPGQLPANSPVKAPPVTQTVITSEVEQKILWGQRVTNTNGTTTNRIIGAHSGEINNANPGYAVEVLETYPDGTRSVKLVTQFDDGNLSKIKASTLFPEGWTQQQVLDSVRTVGGATAVASRADGSALFQGTVNGVRVEVIKVGNNVTAAYPCGKSCTDPTKFKGP